MAKEITPVNAPWQCPKCCGQTLEFWAGTKSGRKVGLMRCEYSATDGLSEVPPVDGYPQNETQISASQLVPYWRTARCECEVSIDVPDAIKASIKRLWEDLV